MTELSDNSDRVPRRTRTPVARSAHADRVPGHSGASGTPVHVLVRRLLHSDFSLPTSAFGRLPSAICLLTSAVCFVILLAGCGQFKALSRADTLSDNEKLDYLVLVSIAPDAAANYLSTSSASARSDYLKWFWSQPPYVADTAARRRFHARAARARDYFGTVDLLGDERVRAYVRYGSSRRETFEPKTVRSETLTIVVQPAEIWTYDSIGLQLDFVKTGVAYKLVGQSEFGPRVTMAALEQVDLGRPAPQPEPNARPLGLLMSLGRLGQQADSVDVELQYGIPLADVARSFPTGVQPLIHVSVEFLPHGNGGRRSMAHWLSTRRPDDTASTALAAAREELNLAADNYRVVVSAVTADGKAAATRSADLNLVDYVRRAQPASDIIFYSLADSAFQSPQFRRGGWSRLVPLVEPAVRSGGTCYILYELYNLALDATGNHRVEANYDFVEESTRELAIAASPTRFVSGIGSTATVVERVHTMNLRPGRYLVVARVRDMEDDRRISLTARLNILPR